MRRPDPEPPQPAPEDSARARRGIGAVYLLAGLLHLATMAFAALYSQGRIPLVVPAGTFSQLYFAHFLFLILAGLGYLGLTFRRTGLFLYEVTAEYLAGIPVFVLVLTALAHLLVKGMIGPWWSLLPGSLLCVYGAGLLLNRRFGVLRADARPPGG